jgi:hypothetical protein
MREMRLTAITLITGGATRIRAEIGGTFAAVGHSVPIVDGAVAEVETLQELLLDFRKENYRVWTTQHVWRSSSNGRLRRCDPTSMTLNQRT